MKLIRWWGNWRSMWEKEIGRLNLNLFQWFSAFHRDSNQFLFLHTLESSSSFHLKIPQRYRCLFLFQGRWKGYNESFLGENLIKSWWKAGVIVYKKVNLIIIALLLSHTHFHSFFSYTYLYIFKRRKKIELGRWESRENSIFVTLIFILFRNLSLTLLLTWQFSYAGTHERKEG